MNAIFDIKNFILSQTLKSIQNLPQDVYALYFFISTNEGFNGIPTLDLMYNTLSRIDKACITPTENCWNIAYWDTDEIPLIGNNSVDSPSVKILSEWFTNNGYNSAKIEHDQSDDFFEYTTGYRVLSEIIEEIAPNVKTFFEKKFNHKAVLLLGEYSYMPCDVKRIASINGDEANLFFQYYENIENSIEETQNNMTNLEDEDYKEIFSQFIQKVKADFKF